MKRILTNIIMVAIVFLCAIGYKIYTGEHSAASVMTSVEENVANGGALSYTETYKTDTSSGVFTYERDSDGNVFIHDLGSETSANTDTFDYTDYKIGEEYYDYSDGTVHNYNDPAFAETVSEDFNVAQYFDEQATYVNDVIKNYGTELFNADIDAEFKREGDKFVSVGKYKDSDEEYRVEIAKDGSAISIQDNTTTVKVSFDVAPIELPK